MLLIAAIPLEKLVAASAPSSIFILSSSTLTVGFVFLPYMCPSFSPLDTFIHSSKSLYAKATLLTVGDCVAPSGNDSVSPPQTDLVSAFIFSQVIFSII